MRGLQVATLDALSPGAEAAWRALERRARPRFFLTWGWIEHWLASLPHGLEPELVVLSTADGPLAAFFVGRTEMWRHGLFKSRATYLNTSGVPRFDELCIEHNAVLVDPAASEVLTLRDWVDAVPGDWDELFLPALAVDAFPGNRLSEALPRHMVRVDREVVAPYVDLARVRQAPEGYLSLLSASTRAHVRRAERGFGHVALDQARSVDEALAIFDELVQFHLAHWHDRQIVTPFDDAWFSSFHRRLIEKRFAHGDVQMLRVRAEGRAIGCLYNFVANGRVLFYQSGFATFDDPHKKPGYVAHAAAIAANARAGHDVYDFLAGDAPYKHSLATDETKLVWARVQRPLVRFAVEDGARRVKRALLAPRTSIQ